MRVFLAIAILLVSWSTSDAGFKDRKIGDWTFAAFTGSDGERICGATFQSGSSYVSFFRNVGTGEIMLVIKNLAWNIDEKAGEKSFGMIRYSNQKNTYAFVHEYEVVESRIMRLLDISPKQLILMSEYSELEFIPSGTISSVILRGKNPLMPVMKMWTTCYVEESR